MRNKRKIFLKFFCTKNLSLFLDIDECKQNKPCSQNCKNTDGSFACSCESGFTLGTDGKTCEGNEQYMH